MEKTKVLFISQEITPYLPENEMSRTGRYLPQGIQERGKEIRTFMPKYGSINERRNQLHEVIRLSGMNLIIDDTDRPLIIKVASIQSARMQIYFIDNEDYFQRRYTLKDENGEYFEDNDERALFFARGVLETVKKLRWSPDIVHCLGWFTALVPLYLKNIYHDDPVFANSKVVYSIYNNAFNKPLRNELKNKMKLEGIKSKAIQKIKDNPDYINLNKMIIDHSDGVIKGSQQIHEEIDNYIQQSRKPTLEYQPEEKYVDAHSEFYDELLKK